MMLLLWLLVVGLVLELLMEYTPLGWRWRRYVAMPALWLMAFATAGLVVGWPNTFTVLLAVVALYRACNIVRVVTGRMHEGYLHHVARRSTFVLTALQAALGLVWWAWQHAQPSIALLFAALASTQLVVGVVLLLSTWRRLQRTRWPATTPALSDAELPTLSVVIPARNETDDLQRCLDSLIASDYPKLEIVVLDDCSQSRRTPEIIRGYAHDGVRFIQGDEPRPTWLPKNQAYERLAAEASGDYLLFCGADIRFAPATLRQVIALMRAKRKDMVSLLPVRAPETTQGFLPAQAMRYFWELVPPRRLFRRPPVLSSCWVITRASLQQAGGFQAVARSIVPEAYFARLAAGHNDGYSFLRASQELGLQSAKNSADQRQTALRTRYPQLHRRLENALLISLAELLFLFGPLPLAIGTLWLPAGSSPASWVISVAALLAAGMVLAAYQSMAQATHVNHWWSGLIALPVVVLYDVAMIHYSLWSYEFSTVDWKGRNICVPAMHVIPHLPKLP